MVLGGILIRKFKFGVVGMARLCVLMSLLAIVVGGGLFISCPDIDFAGVSKRYRTKYEPPFTICFLFVSLLCKLTDNNALLF